MVGVGGLYISDPIGVVGASTKWFTSIHSMRPVKYLIQPHFAGHPSTQVLGMGRKESKGCGSVPVSYGMDGTFYEFVHCIG